MSNSLRSGGPSSKLAFPRCHCVADAVCQERRHVRGHEVENVVRYLLRYVAGLYTFAVRRIFNRWFNALDTMLSLGL